MTDMELMLNCTRCGSFEEYETHEENSNVVYCDECGKKHSQDSIFMVDPDRQYRRDESGALLENLP